MCGAEEGAQRKNLATLAPSAAQSKASGASGCAASVSASRPAACTLRSRARNSPGVARVTPGVSDFASAVLMSAYTTMSVVSMACSRGL